MFDERDLNTSKHDASIAPVAIAKALHVIQPIDRSVIVAGSLNVIR